VSEKPLDDEIDSLDDTDHDGPQIGASAEMEEALRVATEAVESRQKDATAAVDASSPDKLTIELLSAELQDLKSIHEAQLKEAQAQRDQFLRFQAEFENFRNRSLKEKQESLKFGHQNFVKDLLSAVDNLERALEHGAQNASEEVEGVLAGVQLVHREILGAFAKFGVREIEAQDQIFDPAVHEAMGQLPSAEVPANTILHVLQKGYLLYDRMLRPARVMVAREADASQAGAPDESADEEPE
jgi:molecular chaperone GrpE